jgi:hypothetical protein
MPSRIDHPPFPKCFILLRHGKTFVESTDETGRAGEARKAEFGSIPHICTAISAPLRLVGLGIWRFKELL